MATSTWAVSNRRRTPTFTCGEGLGNPHLGQTATAHPFRCSGWFGAARCSLGLAQVYPHLVLAAGDQVRPAVRIPVRHTDTGPEPEEVLVENQRFRLRQPGFPL